MAFRFTITLFSSVFVFLSTLVAALQPNPLGVKLPPSLVSPTPESKADGPELQKLLQNNKEWAHEKMSKDPTYFKQLATGQAPRYLWIGCSDSRVPAESMTNTEPGQVFVHRNIANQVVPNSPNFLSVLTYAIEYLKVEDIIVCGHYKCGGVAASSSDSDFGPALEDWLINLRQVFGENADLVAGIEDPEMQQQRYVELNTKAQCLKLQSHPTVLKAQVANNGIPRIHGLVFDMEKGLLKNIDAPEGKSVAASSGGEANSKMLPQAAIRSKLSNIFKKATPAPEPASEPASEPTSEPAEALVEEASQPTQKESADFQKLLKWLLHLGCPEYAAPLYAAGYQNFESIQSSGFLEADLNGIVPPTESGVRKLLAAKHHIEYF